MINHTEKLLTVEVLEKLPEVAHFSRSISSHKNVALFISQDLKKLLETHLYSPLSLPNQIFSTRQKTQFEQEQEHQNKSKTEV